jgi:hypothetical protein
MRKINISSFRVFIHNFIIYKKSLLINYFKKKDYIVKINK